MVKRIPLTRGYFAIVDDGWHPILSSIPWYARITHRKKVYACSSEIINGKTFRINMQNLIIDAEKGVMVDHKDGNSLNNTRDNLRICNHHQNNANKQKSSMVGATSKYKGVYFAKERGKWKAQIGHNNRRYSIGYFETEEDAAIAYNEEAIKLFGAFACLNVIHESLANV